MDTLHAYLSTYCLHATTEDEHKTCRLSCKICEAKCLCKCHDGWGGYLLGNIPRDQIRAVLLANMFDGDEGGVITMPVSGALTEMVEILCGPVD